MRIENDRILSAGKRFGHAGHAIGDHVAAGDGDRIAIARIQGAIAAARGCRDDRGTTADGEGTIRIQAIAAGIDIVIAAADCNRACTRRLLVRAAGAPAIIARGHAGCATAHRDLMGRDAFIRGSNGEIAAFDRHLLLTLDALAAIGGARRQGIGATGRGDGARGSVEAIIRRSLHGEGTAIDEEIELGFDAFARA